MGITPIANNGVQIPLAGLSPDAVTAKGTLRFSTAGSVDDGKSTLIGRLLHDSQAVYEDQLASVRESRINRSSGALDLSLITDGLRAEREQGITIDVAYRYFTSARRKFIIADTPGHEQYTRNMATGASTADVAVILLDATKGVLAQTRRHTYIASLLGIPHLVAAVNKMDVVGYSRDVFVRISNDFHELARKLGVNYVYSIPVSALEGDNIVRRSSRTPWFDGPPLLAHLEELPLKNASVTGPLRFPVQYVIRPDSQFRGFAGQLVSGLLRPGMDVTALPSGRKTRVKSLVTFDRDLDEAQPGSAITVTLEDEIDVSRGDLLVAHDAIPWVSRRFQAMLVWMNAEPLDPHKLYLLKHTTRTVRGRVTRVKHRIDVNSLERLPAAILQMNDIAAVNVETSLPLFFDAYRDIRGTGSFILVDPITNSTVAAGMIEDQQPEEVATRAITGGGVTGVERRQRFGHSAAIVWIDDRPELAEFVERRLFEQGWHVQLVNSSDFGVAELTAVSTALGNSGAIVVVSTAANNPAKHSIQELFGRAFFDDHRPHASHSEAASQIISGLNSWRALDGENEKEGL